MCYYLPWGNMSGEKVNGAKTGERIFDALRNSERRRILIELVRSIEEGEPDIQYAVPLAFNDNPAWIRLVHVDLPKLEDYGFIDWDRDSQTIRPGENWEDIETVLKLLLDGRERLPFDLLSTCRSGSTGVSHHVFKVAGPELVTAAFVSELLLGRLPVA